jgi:hypothetical protein
MENQETGGVERRTVLRAAAVGTTLWAAPTVQSLMSPAFAVGTGLCPPGHLVRFKYDVDENRFDSGSGSGVAWCLPDNWGDADVSASGAGNIGSFVVDGVAKSITVTISADGKTAQVTLPPGARVEDLQAKAGSQSNGECDDFDYQSGATAVVTLEQKRISFVAGVVCV